MMILPPEIYRPGRDKLIARLLERRDTMHAAEWLDAQRGRYLGGLSFKDSVRLVRVMHELGAHEVLVANAGSGTSPNPVLIIKLPKYHAVRSQIYAWLAALTGSDINSIELDIGQPYALLIFNENPGHLASIRGS